MRKLLYITVFVSGMTSLAVEMAASRLLGNYFGTSNLVWASIIGLILIYLTVGYFLGGRWADRSPRFTTFYQILIWAAFSVGLVPLASRPVLRLAANAFDQLQVGVLAGSFTGVLVLFIIPITLLGTASPFAIRLAIEDPKTAGSISGRMYAISTLGSFLGTFLPVMLFIPLIGTYRTFLVFSAVLLLVAFYGLARSSGWRKLLVYIWMPVVLILLAIFGTRGTDKTSTGMIYETESAYNYIQVLADGNTYYLRLNEGQGAHSMYNPQIVNNYGAWEQVLVAPFFNLSPVAVDQIHSMAILGLAAGTTARQATIVFPAIQIDGYEIDPSIIAVGRKYFDMNEPNLNVIIQDGRWGLNNSGKTYDIISVDAYRPPYIPAQMVTREFFQVVHDHLTTQGVMVINVGRLPNDRRLIEALYATIASVFPSVYVMDVPNTFNSIIFATIMPTQAENLVRNYVNLSKDPSTPALLTDTMKVTIGSLQPTPANGMVFTDDKAPIEWITNSMIINFFMAGEVETLK
jgi:spermidine synthase